MAVRFECPFTLPVGVRAAFNTRRAHFGGYLMTANISSAVMQQRHEVHDSLDDFPTPPWATRALCEFLKQYYLLHLQAVWEPACNRGHMAMPLGEYFNKVLATDVHDYGFHAMDEQRDFLFPDPGFDPDVDWIITNPPFVLGQEFILRALEFAQVGVAVFVRTAFVEGIERYNNLTKDHPEAYFMPFVERVPLFKGTLREPGVKYLDQNGDERFPSTATSYCWLVWVKGHNGYAEMHRIPPCRAALTRPGDYPKIETPIAPLPLFEGGSNG